MESKLFPVIITCCLQKEYISTEEGTKNPFLFIGKDESERILGHDIKIGKF